MHHIPNSDDDYLAFQQFLIEQPEAGDVVKGSGGVRKVPSGAVRSVFTLVSRHPELLAELA